MKQRLSKYLSRFSAVSRRDAEKMVDQGRVTVNGVIVTENPFFLQGGEIVTLDGELISAEEFQYFKYYKPVGLVCSKRDKHNKTIYDSLKNRFRRFDYVGRLDKESEGLLLLTNDGEMIQQLSHPSFAVKREYLVTTNRDLTPSDRERMRKGILDKGEFLKCDHVRKVGRQRYHLSLHTGKNREIRRMCSFLGKKVTKLVRVSYGSVKLGNLKEGEVIPLNNKEMRRLFS